MQRNRGVSRVVRVILCIGIILTVITPFPLDAGQEEGQQRACCCNSKLLGGRGVVAVGLGLGEDNFDLGQRAPEVDGLRHE